MGSMKLVEDETLRQIGIDPEKEMAMVTPAGQYFVFPRFESEPGGCSYVRFVDHAGTEQLYYDADEWASQGREEGEFVMGAILGAMVGGAHLTEASKDQE